MKNHKIHNAISDVAELFGDNTEALHGILHLTRTLAMASNADSTSLFALTSHIQDRVWALEAEHETKERELEAQMSAELGEDVSVTVDADDDTFTITFNYTDGMGPLDSDYVEDSIHYDCEYLYRTDITGLISLSANMTASAFIDIIDVTRDGKTKERFIILEEMLGDLVSDNEGKGYKTRKKAEKALWELWTGDKLES